MVKVLTSGLDEYNHYVEVEHQEADTFQISDAHLYVQKSAGAGIIAVYAAGKWLSAVVVTETS